MNISSHNSSYKVREPSFFEYISAIQPPVIRFRLVENKQSYVKSMFQGTIDFLCRLCQPSAVCLIDCIRRLIGRSAGGWILTRAASPPAASTIERHSPGEPLFHVVVSKECPVTYQLRDLFHKRLMDRKYVRKQLYSTVQWVYPLFIGCVYISFLLLQKKLLCCWWMFSVVVCWSGTENARSEVQSLQVTHKSTENNI